MAHNRWWQEWQEILAAIKPGKQHSSKCRNWPQTAPHGGQIESLWECNHAGGDWGSVWNLCASTSGAWGSVWNFFTVQPVGLGVQRGNSVLQPVGLGVQYGTSLWFNQWGLGFSMKLLYGSTSGAWCSVWNLCASTSEDRGSAWNLCVSTSVA